MASIHHEPSFKVTYSILVQLVDSVWVDLSLNLIDACYAIYQNTNRHMVPLYLVHLVHVFSVLKILVVVAPALVVD